MSTVLDSPVGPAAEAVRVALDQVPWGMTIDDPVGQEAPRPARVYDAVSEGKDAHMGVRGGRGGVDIYSGKRCLMFLLYVRCVHAQSGWLRRTGNLSKKTYNDSRVETQILEFLNLHNYIHYINYIIIILYYIRAKFVLFRKWILACTPVDAHRDSSW